MPYAIHGSLRIHYEIEGSGPPVVLQHGYALSLKHWYALGYVDALKPRYRLILLDARGHGESEKPHEPAAYTLRLRVGDVVAVLDALRVEAAHYWGYSMGGWIGFGMAKYATDRLRSLIIGGAHPYEERLPASSRLDGSDPDAFLAALFGRLGIAVASIPPAIRAELLTNDFRALAAAQQDRPSLEALLPALKVPCLLYAGDVDPRCPDAGRCAQRLSHATFVPLRGLDHGTAFQQAGLVLPHATQFLQTVTDPKDAT
jgi:pimeloyl-ACP methyl ester carboxylesterase